ncbi:DNA ligase [Paenibacillaceae bacterium WGS1546]|uniref:ATP-dependent DNA ligase n=1 Tax=Cohnella sp. WGS1546 TaxID=3366810 RepID=UPI00372CE8B1
MKLAPVIPFEPVLASRCPEGERWIAQIKWDGVRMLAYFDGKDFRLVNRKRNDRTAQYPEFGDPAAYCRASSFILDGEFIAFNESRPSFREIMKRDSLRNQAGIGLAVRQVPVTYMVFDILYANGEWVTGKTLEERQRLMNELVIAGDRVQLCGNFPEPANLFGLMRKRNMEGIVCKSLDSAYALGGKDGRWRKLKITRDLVAAVGGATFSGGVVNSLLLGLYDEENRLHYIGHAGTGKLSGADWRELTERLVPLVSKRMPFALRPGRHKDAVWTAPGMAAKVRYMEWTAGGTMRQPSIQAFMPMASPADCPIDQIGR